MAIVSKIESLFDAIKVLEPAKFPHVWLKAEATLQFGTYPKSTATYSFTTEELELHAEVDTKPVTTEMHDDCPEGEIVDLRHLAPRRTESIDLVFSDLVMRCGSATQALLRGLEEIERRSPGTLDRLSEKKARSKRPVHRQRQALFDMPSQAKHSEQIESGHWVGTNNKRLEALNVLRSAAEIARLKFTIK